MKYSKRFLGLVGIMLVLLIQPSGGADEKDTFMQMSAEGQSEVEVFAYVKSLTLEALLRLGRELSADPIWKQPASGMEYVTSEILSTYADKAGRTASADSLIQEIKDESLPDKWRQQVLSWFCSKARESAGGSWADAVDAEMLARSLLTIVINAQEGNELRQEANANLAYLLTARFEPAIKTLPKDAGGTRTIYEDHLKWLMMQANDLSAEPDLAGATITVLAIYQRLGVPEATEIRDTLLSAFRNRESMASQDKLLLAGILVESGEGGKIKSDLEDCVQKVEDPTLRREYRKLLNQLRITEGTPAQEQSK